MENDGNCSNPALLNLADLFRKTTQNPISLKLGCRQFSFGDFFLEFICKKYEENGKLKFIIKI